MTPANWIALAGVLSASIAFASGLFQYRKAQRWKRAEFVAAEVKEVLKDRWVAVALQLLDFNMNSYNLAKSDSEHELRDVPLTDIDLAIAMEPHSIRSEGFGTAEVRVREAFDAFLDALQRFEHFVAAGLVSSRDFAPYLRYWVTLLGDAHSGRKPQVVVAAIWRYIEFYGYSDVQRFLARFGYDIRLDRANPDLRRQLDSLDRRVLPIPESVMRTLTTQPSNANAEAASQPRSGKTTPLSPLPE
jgi:hypothetical protein